MAPSYSQSSRCSICSTTLLAHGAPSRTHKTVLRLPPAHLLQRLRPHRPGVLHQGLGHLLLPPSLPSGQELAPQQPQPSLLSPPPFHRRLLHLAEPVLELTRPQLLPVPSPGVGLGSCCRRGRLLRRWCLGRGRWHPPWARHPPLSSPLSSSASSGCPVAAPPHRRRTRTCPRGPRPSPRFAPGASHPLVAGSAVLPALGPPLSVTSQRQGPGAPQRSQRRPAPRTKDRHQPLCHLVRRHLATGL